MKFKTPLYSFFSVILILFLMSFVLTNEITKPKYQFDWTTIRPQIKDTVLALADRGVITGYGVGYSGRTPKKWHRAKWFLKNATHEEFQDLLEYKNGAIKGYAFEGLLKKSDKNIFQHLLSSTKDSTIVYTQYGCVVDYESLTSYYLIKAYREPSKEVEFQRSLLSKKQERVIDSLIDIYHKY